MPNEEEDPAESESDAEETEESESEEKEPTIKELMAEIAELKKQIPPAKEEDPAESESEEKGKEKPHKPKMDPLHVDYAEYLKSQMGKSYPKEFDKLPLEVRIPAMKATLSAVAKKPVVKEGVVGKGTPITTFTPPGTNYKEIAKKLRSG